MRQTGERQKEKRDDDEQARDDRSQAHAYRAANQQPFGAPVKLGKRPIRAYESFEASFAWIELDDGSLVQVQAPSHAVSAPSKP